MSDNSAKRTREETDVVEPSKKARTEETKEGEEEFVLVESGDVPTPAEADKAAEAQNEAAAAAPAGDGKKIKAKCKWFDVGKGFGFVTTEAGDDIFCHLSVISNNPGFRGLATEEDIEMAIIKDAQGRDRATEVTAPGGGPVKGEPEHAGMGQFTAGGPAYGAPPPLPKHNTATLADGRFRGQCKWFNCSKGFGFITVEGTEEDLFVHQSEIKVGKGGFRSLAQDENVEFGIAADTGSKRKAMAVTGPGGVDCVGQPNEAPSEKAAGSRGYGGYGGGYGGHGGYGAPPAAHYGGGYPSYPPAHHGGAPQYNPYPAQGGYGGSSGGGYGGGYPPASYPPQQAAEGGHGGYGQASNGGGAYGGYQAY